MTLVGFQVQGTTRSTRDIRFHPFLTVRTPDENLARWSELPIDILCGHFRKGLYHKYRWTFQLIFGTPRTIHFMAGRFESWHSYPSIYAIGHRAIQDLLKGPVTVEEKVDGSQFSFGVDFEGELHVRSKGAKMHVEAPERMFTKAVVTAQLLAPLLTIGYTYRCEYLAKPKHNTLAYNRIPTGHLILFDVNIAEASYLPYREKKFEADRLGLECVPQIFSGVVGSLEQFREFLNRESILGGQKIEGVVVKPLNYDLFGPDKKCLMGKFVSESFKEIHGVEWKKDNPSPTDAVAAIADSVRIPARWNKAVQHLRDRGLIQDSPRDIGPLLKEVVADIETECRQEILDALWQWAWPQIRRRSTWGLPEWYKEELLKSALAPESSCE